MVTWELNKFDLLHALDGFAGKSHLRQHIWEVVVKELLPQMNDEEKDFIWFYSYRDLWHKYFHYTDYAPCGAEDFLQYMAAMCRNNYSVITFKHPDMGEHKQRCYRFQGRWIVENHFQTFIPEEWVVSVEKEDVGEPLVMEVGRMDWWTDTSVYEKKVEQLKTDEWHWAIVGRK